MRCGACGTELQKDARFCHICGQPAPAPVPEESSYCPRCGARLPKVSIFCPQCGIALSDAAPRKNPEPAIGRAAAVQHTQPPARAAEPVPEEKKPAKKAKRSHVGGLLLTLLIIALIIGCLCAVFYVEASTRGQTVTEYAQGFFGKGKEEGPPKWSDLETSGTASAGSGDETSRKGIMTKDVCAIYLELLKSRQEAIERYDWQQRNGELPTRQVVLCDICGDMLPELIWVEAAYDENVTAATLNIAAIRDGAAVILSSRSWDVQAGGGFFYYLFQVQDSKTLYTSSASGEEYWTQRYTAYTEHDGGLEEENLLESVTSDVWDGENMQQSVSYTKAGAEVSADDWNGAVDSLLSGTKTILMYSSDAGDFALNFVSQNGCPAMTCSGAILFLSECLEAVS